MFISTTADCASIATIISVPETKKGVSFNSGYGTADLPITLSGGMITAVGQKADSKIPETLSSVATMATAVGGLARSTTSREGACKPSARLYNIDKGVVDPKPIVVIPWNIIGAVRVAVGHERSDSTCAKNAPKETVLRGPSGNANSAAVTARPEIYRWLRP